MGRDLNKYDALIIIFLFLISLKIWAAPSLSSPYLFGEGDAYWHYGQSAYIAESDHASPTLPYSYINKYFLNNKALGPLAREYPPMIHINYASQIVIGGDRFVTLGIYKAITSFLGFLGVYLLSRLLFSQQAAIIASWGLIFSNRIFSTFLYGQQPTITALLFTPLILFSFYKTATGMMKGEKINKQIIVLALLLCSQYLLHLQALFISVVLLFVSSCFFAIKMIREKKKIDTSIYFSKKNLALYAIITAVSLAIILPFAGIYLGAPQEAFGAGTQERDFLRAFEWGISPKAVEGSYPASFVMFKSEYSYYLLPFLIIGILFSAINYRKNNYYFMISLLAGIYILLHMDLWMNVVPARIARMMLIEPYIFWIFISLGIFVSIKFIVSFIRPFMKKIHLSYTRHALVIASLAAIYILLGASVKATAESAYPELVRVGSDQLAAADWINENLPMNSHIFVKNDHVPWRIYKYRFIISMAHRPGYKTDNISQMIIDWNTKYSEANEEYGTNLPMIYYKYLLIDYSDYAKLARADPQYAELIRHFKNYENKYFENMTPVYNSRNIVIYNITGMEVE